MKKNYNYQTTGIKSQVNKDGKTVTIFTKGGSYIKKSSFTRDDHKKLAKIRARNRMREADKVTSIMREFRGDKPNWLVKNSKPITEVVN